jgi:hypothetical protein
MSRATQVILARELREGRGLSQRDHVDHGVIRRHLLRRSQAEADESQQLDRGRRREQRHREHHSSGDAIDIIPTTLLEILPRRYDYDCIQILQVLYTKYGCIE